MNCRWVLSVTEGLIWIDGGKFSIVAGLAFPYGMLLCFAQFVSFHILHLLFLLPGGCRGFGYFFLVSLPFIL